LRQALLDSVRANLGFWLMAAIASIRRHVVVGVDETAKRQLFVRREIGED
jgi:hypothetical protein